jgi:hypothetical protein
VLVAVQVGLAEHGLGEEGAETDLHREQEIRLPYMLKRSPK